MDGQKKIIIFASRRYVQKKKLFSQVEFFSKGYVIGIVG